MQFCGKHHIGRGYPESFGFKEFLQTTLKHIRETFYDKF